jgi:signal transduction histidine kinase
VITGPQLSTRIRPRTWVMLDYLLAALCALLVYGAAFHLHGLHQPALAGWDAHTWLPPLLALWVAAPVAARRSHPLAALVVALAGGLVVLAAGGDLSRGTFVPLALVLYLVAVACPGPVALAGLCGSLVLMGIQSVTLHVRGDGPGNALAASLALVLCWLAGYMARQRRAYAARLRQQVANAAVMQERLRIARELHDAVGHHVALISVQAGAMGYLLDTDLDRARESLAHIQRASESALEELRLTVGLLRQPGEVEPTEPAVLAYQAGLPGAHIPGR